MSVSVKIELDLSELKDENLKQAIQGRLNELAKREYNKLANEIKTSVASKNAAAGVSTLGLNTLGGPYAPPGQQKDGSNLVKTNVPWGKFWYAEAERFEDRFARVYIGCGDGSKVIEVNYDFLYQFTRLEKLDDTTIQEGVNNIVPDWVGGSDQLMKDTDFTPFSVFEPQFGPTYAAGNSVRGYSYCGTGSRWIYQPQGSVGLSIQTTGPFWFGQHVIYNPIRNYLKLEHIVLPYKKDKAVVIIYGANIIQERRMDFIRSSFAGGTKSSPIRVYMHSPFLYDRTQNLPKHEWIFMRAPANLSLGTMVARLAPYPNDSTSSFDENTVVQFQVMAAPDAGSYYRNGAKPPPPNPTSEANPEEGEPQPEWLEGYPLGPVHTVTTVPVDPLGDPPADHGYDLSDNFSLPLIGQGAAPRSYRGFATIWPTGQEPEPAAFTIPNKGDYLWIKIISVTDKDGNSKWPIQDTTGYDYNRYNHMILCIDFYTNLSGSAGPSNTSTASFSAKCDLIQDQYKETQYIDPEVHPLIKCFLVSEDNIKEISTPGAIAEKVIPRTIGTLSIGNELVDENGDPIPEDIILQQINSQFHFASGGDPLDSGNYGPRVSGVLDTEPKNLMVNSENLNLNYPQITVGQNVSAQLNYDKPPFEGFKLADRLIMEPKKRNTIYELGPGYLQGESPLDPEKTYCFSAYFRWAGTGEKEESYPNEEPDNTEDTRLRRTFVTISHYNNDGLITESTINPLGFDWYRHSLMFKPTGNGDRLRFWNWDLSENAKLDYSFWGLQIEEFKDTSQEQKEGPTEYQMRGDYTQAFYGAVLADSTARKQSEPLPRFSVDTVPVYEYTPFKFDSDYEYKDFPMNLGIKGQPYNWLDTVTWRTYDPQPGELTNPIGSPFGKWTPIIYDVIFDNYKGGQYDPESRVNYSTPIFDAGPKTGDPDENGNYFTSHISYDPVEYSEYSVIPYDAAIKRLAEGYTAQGKVFKGQKTARLNATNDEAIYANSRTKKTQAIRPDTVEDFDTINKRKFRNRYNWSTDQKQMRIVQFSDYNRQPENLEYLQSLGFSENDLNF